MYLDFKVKIPDSTSGITRKTIKGVTYIYYTYNRSYDSGKKFSVPKNTSIGKCAEDDPDMMYPNTNYIRFFPETELPEEKEGTCRSGCLRIGTWLILRRIISGYHLDEILGRLIGKESGLFLDIAAYTIVAENNAGQYYPDYAYNHPLFTDGMKVYSDSKVSSFINSITRDQSIAFQNEWNESRDHREKIYISYDSANKNCQAGDIDFVEYGHPKDNAGAPVLNYSIAYDRSNSVPLFYEEYPGSIVDISQLQLMLEKANGYGYKRIGFILDRGYFSRENIRYMDSCGYEFVIMMKGMKDLVKGLVLQVKGTFEESREHSIRDYKVSGITVRQRLYPSEKMTAEDALDLYKSRDASEKLFRGDKSYLGNRSFRIQSNESLHAKIFIEFVALIIRNYFHMCLKEQLQKNSRKQNYMTVPAAIRELEKIEIIRQPDKNYRLDHAVTATQKEILKAFGMTASNIREQAIGINNDLQHISRKEA